MKINFVSAPSILKIELYGFPGIEDAGNSALIYLTRGLEICLRLIHANFKSPDPFTRHHQPGTQTQNSPTSDRQQKLVIGNQAMDKTLLLFLLISTFCVICAFTTKKSISVGFLNCVLVTMVTVALSTLLQFEAISTPTNS